MDFGFLDGSVPYTLHMDPALCSTTFHSSFPSFPHYVLLLLLDSYPCSLSLRHLRPDAAVDATT